jgi:YVTN family beta-propeller protein
MLRGIRFPLHLRFFSIAIFLILLGASAVAQNTVVRIIQTNNAGTNAHLIDPTTHKVIAIINDVPNAHAAADHPDGLYYYFANELHNTIDVVDTRTLRPIMHIPLSGTPNKPAINKVNKKLYVGIRGAPFVDIIDTNTNKIIKSVKMLGGVHNVYVSADGKWALAGLGITPKTKDEPTIQVIDTSTDEIAFGIPLEGGRVRPMAIESNPDGSPKRVFAQVTSLHGFYVIDWSQRKFTSWVSVPAVPMSRRNFDGIQEGPSHGLIVLPDQSALWFASRIDSAVYGWSLPDLQFLGSVHVGPSPQWITPTPDSRFIYVSVVGTNETVVVDVKARQQVARIPVGQAPKRNSTHVIPANRVEMESVRVK